MLSKNELKYIQSLCHKKQREEEGLFVAEGPKIVGELLQSDYRIKKVYATKKWIEKNKNIATSFEEITDDELSKISSLQAPNEVLAVVEQKVQPALPRLQQHITLLLDGIQDPGNLGTIIRIADWFGITQLICSEDTVELYNPKVIQSTMGSFLRVQLWYSNLLPFVSKAEVPVMGALLHGKSVYVIKKPVEAMLIIGNESKGIRENLLPYITAPVTIPRKGGAESLNAAVATGILLSHLT
ncbi:MAG: RNA methyltransferase [Bacteroidota bacterium]|nr:RNA methyltransferase [Bacteroidota bacterium]